MYDTSTPTEGSTCDTRMVLNLGVYRQRLAALGAKNAEDGRRLAGISRATEYRWKRGVKSPNWQKAREVAQRLGVENEKDLFAEVAA